MELGRNVKVLENVVAEPAKPKHLPSAECGHTTYTLGCAHCFYTLNMIASREVQASAVEAQVAGATLMCWHLMMILERLENAAYADLQQSLDLRKREVIKNVYTNLRSLSVYITRLGTNQQLILQALDEAAIVAQQLMQEVKRRATEEQAVAKLSSSGIIITN